MAYNSEWSLRLKLVTVDNKTVLLGREFQTFVTRCVRVRNGDVE